MCIIKEFCIDKSLFGGEYSETKGSTSIEIIDKHQFVENGKFKLLQLNKKFVFLNFRNNFIKR